jgi:hypothetical protein
MRAIETHTKTVGSLESSPWWLKSLDLPENYLKQCTLNSCTLLLANQLNIDPQTICTNLGWISLGKCTPTAAGNCALVIPPSKLIDKGLKLNSLGSSEMGRNYFPIYDLMISRESQIFPPQLLHPQWMSNAPKIISSLESNGKLGNRCAFPSSQLGRKGISLFSMVGISRLTKPPYKLRPHPK